VRSDAVKWTGVHYIAQLPQEQPVQELSRIVGENLKRIRAEQGLSLDALAKLSDVSKSRLGQIERGEANPTISIVWQIARALKVEFSALVTNPQADSVVVRQSELAPILEDEGRCRDFALFPFDPALGFEVYTAEIDAGGCLRAEAHPAGARETVTVVSGKLTISIAGEEHHLGAGDGIRFLADVPHEYRNAGDSMAVISMIMAYPRA
jgi:XRE family transcriptional regulator, regulator of sulfur utilization